MKALLIAPPETRGLDPLARVTPAPLLPLFGAPLISPLLQRLVHSGVKDVLLACQSRPALYNRALSALSAWGLNFDVLEFEDVDSASLTLDAVTASGFHNQTLAVLPANCWADADWPALEASHRESGGGLSAVTANGVRTGILLVDPGVSMSSAPWRTLSADFRWRPVTSWPEYWALAKESLEDPKRGVAPDFDPAGSELRLDSRAEIDPAADIEGPVWLSAGARVYEGATLRGPIWIGKHCRVGPGVRLEACIVEADTRLHGPLELSHALAIANRAIDFATGEVRLLDEDRPIHRPGDEDVGMTEGLAQLATRTARRRNGALEAAR